jgi:hypothetical protein
MDSPLPVEQRRFFRDQLREARSLALLDAEGFSPIVTALERLGSVLVPGGQSLSDYRSRLLAVARRGPVSPFESEDRGTFTPLDVLFAAVKEGRNDAVHHGAYVRHLVRHCVELALHVEDGLMADATSVLDFMVRDPVCAELWQPVALARQQMLVNSYSYLPIRFQNRWHLLSDHAIARYLAEAENRRQASRVGIGTASEQGRLTLDPAIVVAADATVQHAIRICDSKPVLVVEHDRLLGIATPFDFL